MGSACGGAAPATGCVNVAARGGLVEAAAAVGHGRRRGEEAMAVSMVRPLPPLPKLLRTGEELLPHADPAAELLAVRPLCFWNQ